RYVTRDGKESAQGILQTFVANQGDAWSYTLKSLSGFYAAAQTAADARGVGDSEKAAFVAKEADEFLKSAALLGQRTAEMHVALAADGTERVFAPEPFTMEFQSQLEESVRGLSERVFAQLREKISGLPLGQQETAKRVSTQEAEIGKRIQKALSKPIR